MQGAGVAAAASVEQEARWRELGSKVRAFAAAELEVQAASFDRLGRLNRPAMARAADEGLLGITVPTAEGGAGHDTRSAVIVHEELARSDPGFALAFLAHAILFVNNFFHAADPAQRARVLPRVLSGEWLGAMGMTEPGGGTDVLGMRTTAERRGDHYLLRGRKTLITNAPDAHCFLVYAKFDGEITSFLVERGAPGFAVGAPIEKMGMRGAPMAELVFEDCLVSAENLIGREKGGLVQMLRNLEIERLCLAAISLGIAGRCVDEMIRVVARGQMAGSEMDAESLAEDGHAQRLLAESYAQTQAAKALVHGVAERSSPARLDWLGADAAKLFAAPVGKRVADRAVQLLAMAGSGSSGLVERLLRDAKLIEIGGGTLEAHHRNILRELTKPLRRGMPAAG